MQQQTRPQAQCAASRGQQDTEISAVTGDTRRRALLCSGVLAVSGRMLEQPQAAIALRTVRTFLFLHNEVLS